jgi:hypothetical protein
MLSAPLASSEQLVAQGLAAMRAGNASQARVLLGEALQIDSKNVTAWLWLSGAVATDAERRYCLEQVLGLDGAHAAARRGLEQLPTGVAAVSPFAIATPTHDIAQSSPPPVAAREPILEPVAPVDSSTERGVSVPAIADYEHILGLLAPARAFADNSAQRLPAPTPSAAPAVGNPPPFNPAAQLDDKVAKFVIRGLGKHVARNDIIRELTEWRRLAWVDAERLVAQVERKHLRSIALRQGPFFICLAFGSMGGGALFTVGSGYRLYLALTYVSIATPWVLFRDGGFLLTGLAMFGGGLLGVWQIIRAILFNR